MKKLSFFWFLIWFAPYCAVAQICPSMIDAATQIKNKPAGWQVDSNSTSYYLYSISIIEGAILRSDDNPPAQLVPEFVGNAQYWKFAKPVGNSEMWMICGYAGTPLVLKSRIHPDVVECLSKPEGNPKAQVQKDQRVNAMCVSKRSSGK